MGFWREHRTVAITEVTKAEGYVRIARHERRSLFRGERKMQKMHGGGFARVVGARGVVVGDRQNLMIAKAQADGVFDAA